MPDSESSSVPHRPALQQCHPEAVSSHDVYLFIFPHLGHGMRCVLHELQQSLGGRGLLATLQALVEQVQLGLHRCVHSLQLFLQERQKVGKYQACPC